MASMSPNKKLLCQSFMDLPQPRDMVQCAYVWIDGSLRNFRSKDKTWTNVPVDPQELPLMEFCGSATDFEEGNLADFYAKPVKIYADPLRRESNKIILCETYSRDQRPTFANNRYRLKTTGEGCSCIVKQSSFDQTYVLRRKDGKLLSYMDPAYDTDSKSMFACGRAIAESHYRACIYAGIELASLEPLSNLGIWRYSVGPSDDLCVSDDLWASRFLLLRVAEDFGVDVDFDHSGIFSNCILETQDLSSDQRLRTDSALLEEFVVKKGKSVRIIPRQKKLIIADMQAHVDPYAILIKVREALKSVVY